MKGNELITDVAIPNEVRTAHLRRQKRMTQCRITENETRLKPEVTNSGSLRACREILRDQTKIGKSNGIHFQQSIQLFQYSSEYRQSITMRRNASFTVVRRTCNEEGPPALLSTRLRQFLQVEHFTKWHAPKRQNVLMQHVILLTRPSFKCWSITSHCRKIAIMKPIFHGLFLLDSSPALSVIFSGTMRPQSCCGSSIWGFGMVC